MRIISNYRPWFNLITDRYLLYRTSALSVSVSIMMVLLAPQLLAQSPWYYKLGKLKSSQQVNLCVEERDVIRLAEVFETEGARPGYAALAQTNGCSLRIASFTPVEIVKQVLIQSDDNVSQYAVNFVKVRTEQGDVQYLVTTRHVKKD